MSSFWRVSAGAASIAIIVGAAVAWHAYKANANARFMAEKARVTRIRAEHGDVLAGYTLGSMYLYGHGVPQDYSEAVRWFRSGADRGDAASEYGVGYMLDKGNGVQQDFAQALSWYQKAAKQNSAAAQCGIASMYYQGRGLQRLGPSCGVVPPSC